MLFYIEKRNERQTPSKLRFLRYKNQADRFCRLKVWITFKFFKPQVAEQGFLRIERGEYNVTVEMCQRIAD